MTRDRDKDKDTRSNGTLTQTTVSVVHGLANFESPLWCTAATLLSSAARDDRYKTRATHCVLVSILHLSGKTCASDNRIALSESALGLVSTPVAPFMLSSGTIV